METSNPSLNKKEKVDNIEGIARTPKEQAW